MKKVVVYLAVTADELELPVCFGFKNLREISEWFGIPKSTVELLIKTGAKSRRGNCKFIQVTIYVNK